MTDLDGDVAHRDMQGMGYTVSTFREVSGERHPCSEPLVIPAAEFPGYGATIHALITSVFEGGPSDAFNPTGLEIIDPTGRLVFTYVRPTPGRE